MLKGRIPNPSPFLKVPPLKRTLKSPSSPHIVYPFIYGSIFTPISNTHMKSNFQNVRKSSNISSPPHFILDVIIHHFSTAMFCSMSRFCWKKTVKKNNNAGSTQHLSQPTKGTDHQFNGEDHRIAVTNRLRGGGAGWAPVADQ